VVRVTSFYDVRKDVDVIVRTHVIESRMPAPILVGVLSILVTFLRPLRLSGSVSEAEIPLASPGKITAHSG